jgi:hypothetical protein
MAQTTGHKWFSWRTKHLPNRINKQVTHSHFKHCPRNVGSQPHSSCCTCIADADIEPDQINQLLLQINMTAALSL